MCTSLRRCCRSIQSSCKWEGFGVLPLYAAAAAGHCRMLQLLLQHEGVTTPAFLYLLVAAAAGSTQSVQQLLAQLQVQSAYRPTDGDLRHRGKILQQEPGAAAFIATY